MTINRETFEAWLFSQPDDATFSYLDNRDCLVCKFLKDTSNGTDIHCGPFDFTISGNVHSMPRWIDCCDEKSLLWVARVFPRNSDLTISFKSVKLAYIQLFGNPMEPVADASPIATPIQP